MSLFENRITFAIVTSIQTDSMPFFSHIYLKNKMYLDVWNCFFLFLVRFVVLFVEYLTLSSTYEHKHYSQYSC